MRLNAFLLAALITTPALLHAQTTATPATATTAPTHYTTSTTDLGTLLDDPAAKAVIAQHLPELVKSDQIDQARGMSLKDIQPYSQDMLTDKILAEIDADLAKLPPKKP